MNAYHGGWFKLEFRGGEWRLILYPLAGTEKEVLIRMTRKDWSELREAMRVFEENNKE